MGAAGRRERTAAADALCARAYDDEGGPEVGVALVAVGGYGRGELAPYSDLDVVLLHDDGCDPGGLAERVWYPLWDAGVRLDHAVRSTSGLVDGADADVRVALGLLDLRHLAGDPGLTLRSRSSLLTRWRRSGRDRVGELGELTRARHGRAGELAHLAVPDLKESEGGLRDVTALAALAATWLVDVPPEVRRARERLLDLRDALHRVRGRPGDRIGPEDWAPLADELGWAGPAEAQRRVRELGRRTTHLSRLAWRRAEQVARPAAGPSRGGGPSHGGGPRRPPLLPLAPGVAVSSGEVVLGAGAAPGTDPLLLLRASAEAAERGLALAPTTAARLVAEGAPLPCPWPAEGRRLLVRLLLAGPGLREVWETLEETGAVAAFLPEWERVRLLPHVSPIHRHTVDRHLVETCVHAAARVRDVARPDVLAVAALLHDIGKGSRFEHAAAGEPVARAAAERMGFDPADAALVGTLVRHHLLLAGVATTRDPDDPATAAHVADRLGGPEALDLLAALTEADARATAAQAWTPWRAALVGRLVARTRAAFAAGELGSAPPLAPEATVEVPAAVLADPARADFRVEESCDGARVTVVSGDRVGLLADVAGVLALGRLPVRSARAWSQDGYGVSVWDVAGTGLDPAVLRQRYAAVRAGRAAPATRRCATGPDAAPVVVVRHEASTSATVLEVRAADRPGVVHLVCSTLAELEVSVRSAHVETLGPQAVDVFYLQEHAAGALGETRAAEAAHRVRAALED